MSHRSKWLTLFALFLLAVSALAACAPSQKDGHPLQPTLSFLETKAARLEETATPQTLPGGETLSVPFTGAGTTQAVVTEFLQPALEASRTPTPPQTEEIPTSDAPGPLASPTFECPAHDATITLSTPKTKIKVGEAIEVKVVLENSGCVMLGLPQYRLAILNSEGKAIFSPDKPEPIVHSLGVNPGQTDEVTYLLQAVSPGKATLSALASFEVHLGYPGPAYWGAGSAQELIIQVEP